ncbi:ATP-binding cassette domain-containing protein [Rhodobacter capsulatus]|uniref:ATP-binding cassette domain-containing protein n=1 Tax=Rhodobacter capsulatus TaxID=1061 RepID=A0A4U1JM02_RHOCA|nr:ATP-binding cassette domain-containing protein [Rhodobacter capsulatus]TKD14537.1 ATP-binding cassette domain-containing protein [Rhodobacter capsulatus]
MTALLEAVGLARVFPDRPDPVEILKEISFSVAPEEFVSIVGPSGCGKTTLLMCLAGLLPPSSGTVRFRGQPVTEPPRGVSVVFQDYSRSLLPWKSARENVTLGMRRLGLGRAAARDRADDLLAEVGLSGFEGHFPWQLSGGMQQRVAIARALAAESALLLLDEPLAAVDAQTRADLQDLLRRLARKFRQACLLVTHDVDEAVYMADRVLVLSRRPTRILREVPLALGGERDQIDTRERPDYLAARHEILTLIRAARPEGAGA